MTLRNQHQNEVVSVVGSVILLAIEVMTGRNTALSKEMFMLISTASTRSRQPQSSLQPRSPFSRARRFLCTGAAVLSVMLFAERSFADYTNGIYAEFNTSMGSFTCRLDYSSE